MRAFITSVLTEPWHAGKITVGATSSLFTQTGI
jgi:hypothetical protein